MKLEMTGEMRMEQRMKLAPHMIQSMEILQLPILALQERIEQELNNNPVLEMAEPSTADETESVEKEPQDDISQKDLIINTDNNKVEDFQRLENVEDDFREYIEQAGPFYVRRQTDEQDRKLEAIKNAAAPPPFLHDHLMEQWRLVEADEPVKKEVF